MAPGLEKSAAHAQAITVFLLYGVGNGVAALIQGFGKIDRYAKWLEVDVVEPSLAKDIGHAGIGTGMDDESIGMAGGELRNRKILAVECVVPIEAAAVALPMPRQGVTMSPAARRGARACVKTAKVFRARSLSSS